MYLFFFFFLGFNIIECMTEGMIKSRTILIIVSEMYLSKALCQLEMDIALNVHAYNKKIKIIVVELGKGAFSMLPQHVKLALSNHVFLQWPEKQVHNVIIMIILYKSSLPSCNLIS